MLTDEQSGLVRILRWSEKYTKTDMVYLASGGLWSIIGQIVAAITALTVSVIFGRYVPKDIYGNYKFILSVVGILSVFSLSNFGPAVAQSAARGFDGSLAEGFKLNLRWSALIFIGTLAVGAYYLFSGNVVLAFGILLGGFATPFLSGVNLAGSYLGGKQDFARATIYFGVVGVLVPALALVTTVFLTTNIFVLTTVYFLTNLIIDSYFYLRTVQIYNVYEGRTDSEMRSYGKHLSVMSIISGIAGSIDQLLLFHYGGAVNLAVYAFSIGIIDQIKGPIKTLDKMMQARFSKRSSVHIEESIENKMLWMLAVSIIGFAIFYTAVPFLYQVLFPTYLESVEYARIYSLVLLTLGTIPIGSYFAAHKRIRDQYIMNIGGSIIQIAAVTIGVIFWGLLGLVIARVCTTFLNAALMLILYYIAPARD